MAVYKNSKGYAAVTTVEFTKTDDGWQKAFFHLRSAQDLSDFKKHLRDSGLNHTIEAETAVSGAPLVIVELRDSKLQTLDWLNRQGGQFELSHKQKGIDPWIIRSILGFGGQTLQLASSFMRPITELNKGKGLWARIDKNIFIFAAANMTANVINLVYKAQDKDDPHQLRYLKDRTNYALSAHLSEGEVAPNIDDKRKTLREDYKDPNRAQTLDSFMRANSVNVGELGLRYIGAYGIAFQPSTTGNIFKGKLPLLSTNPFRKYAGLSSIFGKTVALNSAIADPYNPQPKTWWDEVREKYTFLGGGLIEAGAFSALAYDNFFNSAKKMSASGIDWKHVGLDWSKFCKKIGINGVQGTVSRDWLGGVGASMFVTGYIVRSWAQYGQRNVDMDELYAHVSDTLAKTPHEKIPQLVADTAADIKTHFKNNSDLDYSTIYTALVNDLKRYHHIDLTASLVAENMDRPINASHDTAPRIQIQGPATEHVHDKAREIIDISTRVSR